jgi:predicted Mrr-cat superfamily restriction endonuclease
MSNLKPSRYISTLPLLLRVFFRVRLWTRKELLEQLFTNYDRLDEEMKAELPLKRVWMVAAQENELL